MGKLLRLTRRQEFPLREFEHYVVLCSSCYPRCVRVSYAELVYTERAHFLSGVSHAHALTRMSEWEGGWVALRLSCMQASRDGGVSPLLRNALLV